MVDMFADVYKASFESLENFSEFTKTLMFVTKPETKLVDENYIGTKKTHELLSLYHSQLKDPDITKKEKKERCTSILNELEKDNDVIDMFKSFSLNLKVGDLKQIH